MALNMTAGIVGMSPSLHVLEVECLLDAEFMLW